MRSWADFEQKSRAVSVQWMSWIRLFYSFLRFLFSFNFERLSRLALKYSGVAWWVRSKPSLQRKKYFKNSNFQFTNNSIQNIKSTHHHELLVHPQELITTDPLTRSSVVNRRRNISRTPVGFSITKYHRTCIEQSRNRNDLRGKSALFLNKRRGKQESADHTTSIIGMPPCASVISSLRKP